jgi:hypothetical protein
VATNDVVTAHAREGGGWLLRHHAGVAGHAFVSGEKVRLASRVVLGAGDGARAVQEAVQDEWEPLTASDFAVRNASDAVRYARYDSVRGLYRFETPGMGFSQAFSETPNEYPSLQLDVTNTDRARQLYVMQATTSGGLEAAVWLDASRRPLPIPIQVSKNFGGEKEEPFFVPKDTSFGESIAPLVLEAGEQRSLTLQHLYQNWGRTPLKQLSSVSFFVPYYHSSTGVTETSCWVPHFVDNAGWILPDFRARSGVMWTNQPQFDSVGKNVILRYQDASGRHLPEYVRTDFESVGPVYSAFTMHFVTDDGKARLSVTPTELPHTGEHRAFTRVRVEFQDAVTIENAPENFELFSTKSDHSKQKFLRYGFWGAAESRLERTINYADAKTEVVPLGTQHPYWALYNFTQLDGTEAKRGANIGLLVRRADIVLGGKPYTGSLAFALKKHGDGLTTGALTFPASRLEFKKGDLIDLDLILLPYGSVATKSDASLVKLRQQWAVDDLEVTVTRGTKLRDFVPTLRAENGVAEFEFKGGSERTVVRVEGFHSYQAPAVECEDGGELVPVNFSVRGQDGVQAYVAADGTYGFAFPIELGKPGRCRVTAPH